MTNLFRKQIERHFATSRPLRASMAAWRRGRGPIQVIGPKGAYLSLVLDELHAAAAGPSLVVTPTEREAESIAQDLELVRDPPTVVISPGGEPRPYEGASPLASIFGDRVQILTRLLRERPSRRRTAARAAHPGAGSAYLTAQIFTVTRGQSLDPAGNRRPLARAGYLRVPRSPSTGSSPCAARSSTCSFPARNRPCGSSWTSTR